MIAMYLLIIASLPIWQLGLSLPQSELSSRDTIFGHVRTPRSVVSTEGGFATSVHVPGGENHISNLLKRAPPVLESNPPPNTQFQNVAGYPWDTAQRDRVIKAWRAAKELATHAKNSLTAIAPDSEEFQRATQLLPACANNRKGQAERNNCLRHYIADKNLAYTQLFGANPEMLSTIETNFQTILDNVEKLNAPDRGNQDLYLTAAKVMIDSSNGKDACARDTYAFVISVSNVQTFQNVGGVQPPNTAWVLNFCPKFSTMDRMETQLQTLQVSQNFAQDQAKICNLDNLDSTARVMLHEWTHLPWTLDTNAHGNPRDVTHWESSSSWGTEPAMKRGKETNQRMHTIKFSSKNADSYAWMGVYNYFNNLDKCSGIQYKGEYSLSQGCTDVWPTSTKKIVKYQWENYPNGND